LQRLPRKSADGSLLPEELQRQHFLEDQQGIGLGCEAILRREVYNRPRRNKKSRLHLLHEQSKPTIIHDPLFPQRRSKHQRPQPQERHARRQHVPAMANPFLWLATVLEDVRQP